MKINALVFAFPVLLLCSCTVSGPGDAPVGELPSAPAFDLVSLSGGTLSSDDLSGKVVVLDFWATWCAPCIEEIPMYNELYGEQAGENFEFLGVTVMSGSTDDVRPYIDEFDIQYPVVMGTDEVVEGVGGIIGWPTTFVITPDWKIYKKYLGQRTDKKEQIEQDIRDLTRQDVASIF